MTEWQLSKQIQRWYEPCAISVQFSNVKSNKTQACNLIYVTEGKTIFYLKTIWAKQKETDIVGLFKITVSGPGGMEVDGGKLCTLTRAYNAL